MVSRGEREHQQGRASMSLGPDRTVSVRQSMATSYFSPFLQRPFNNFPITSNEGQHPQHYPGLSQSRPYQPRTVPVACSQCEGSALSSGNSRAGPNPLSMAVGSCVDNGSSTPMAAEQEHFFENFFHPANGRCTSDEGGGLYHWPDMSVTSCPGNFRPTNLWNGSFDGGMIGKVDNSDAIAAPAAFPHQVDSNSGYENIHEDAWILPTAEYNVESPGSHDSKSNGPKTPPNLVPDRNFIDPCFGSSVLSGPASQIESLSLTQPPHPRSHEACPLSVSGQCQCFQPNVSVVEPTTLSTIWNAVQPDPTEAHTINSYPHIHGLPIPPFRRPVTGDIAAGFLRASVQSEMETSPEPSNYDDQSQESSETEPEVSHQCKTLRYGATAGRRVRDNYLLEMRGKGHSYREIKRHGRFKEALSTLRGRVRVLTKDKSERVRKPEWTDHDVHLLRHAVARFGEGGSLAPKRNTHGRMPWKKISQWMHAAGSSYLFSPATCAKKWREGV